jgi:V/A-type H+-transporting ATPase subunit C
MSMVAVSRYSVIHARVRALYSDLIAQDRWVQLCAAPDFPSLIQILKATAYGPYLDAVLEEELTTRRAVYQIKKHLAEAFATILRLAPTHARALVQQLYRQFEVDNLKALLRGVVTGATWDEVRYLLFPLAAATALPMEDMLAVGSVDAAVQLLRGTPYYATLAHALERYTEEQSLFPLEVTLDLDYWRELWRDVNHLPGQDREWALRLVGSVIDLNNLMWTLRYRVYHGLSQEEIINYTLPFGRRVRDEDIRAIAAGEDMITVVSRVYPQEGDVASFFQQPESGLPKLEARLQRRVAEECQSAFIGYPFHLGIPIAYLLLNELEIADLTALLEARSLRIPPAGVRPYLVLGCSSE